MIHFKLDWKGFRQVDKALEQMIRQVPQGVGVGLYLEAEQIMSTSKREVPVDTGRLRSTGYVQLPQMKGTQIGVTLGYGTNYAVYVHEILSARHVVGKAKYLQDPLERAAQGLGNRVAKHAARYIARGGRGFPMGGLHPVRPPGDGEVAV